ncbi:MAG: division/cell wall cluster transcriptional repressor MraZ [Myxococcota bacterium]
MLRGNFSAKIDDKGRLKIPSGFRTPIEEKFGDTLFVTSLSGESVRIYPMTVWTTIEEKLARIPSTHPSRSRFFDRVNFYGQPAEIDKQGRVSVHTRLREAAGMVGEVDVFGLYDHLEVWNHDRFLARLEREPFTDDDARALAEFGI